MISKRRRARELVLQGLYAWEIAGNPEAAIVKEISQRGEEDKEILPFAVDLLKKSIAHKEELDHYVSAAAVNWEFKRIALIDRLILIMAICELLFFEEIPPKVTINEAIDLAKSFSTAQSGRFVNGILDSLFNRFKKENRIIKRGRGLINNSPVKRKGECYERD
jgi:N utilization substance protein B